MPYILALVLLLLPSFARGDDAEPDVVDIPPGVDNIIVLQEGEKAPFTGQLFDNGTAFRWGGWLMQYKLRLKNDVELQKKLCASDLKLLEHKLEIEQQKHFEVLGLYDVELDKKDATIDRLEDPPFFRTAWFGFTAGVALTAIGVIVAAVSL